MTLRTIGFSILIFTLCGLFGSPAPVNGGKPQDREQEKTLALVRALTHVMSPHSEDKILGLTELPKCAPVKKDDAVVTGLSRAFYDADPKVRLAACKAAGALLELNRDYHEGTHFSVVFGDSDKDVREAAYIAFSRNIDRGMYGQDEILMLNRLIKEEKDPRSRDRAYWVLGTIGKMRHLYQDSDLVTVAGSTAVERMKSESTDEYSPTTGYNLLYRAVRTLGNIGRRTPQASPALIRLCLKTRKYVV